MDPALLQRLVTFHSYFFGFLILDRQSFFGDPPSPTETFVMALLLALAVTLLSPLVASLLDRRGRKRTIDLAPNGGHQPFSSSNP